MKKTVKKILFPNNIIGFLIFNFGAGLLIYVFSNHLEDTPLAYVSYLLSSYALTVFCIWFYKVCKFGNETVKKSKAYHLYQKNSLMVSKGTILFSLVLNFLCGIFKLGIGFYYKSWWFITFAVYYFLLCFMKIPLIKNTDSLNKDFKEMKNTGIALLSLNIILVGIIVLIISQNRIINYDGFLIYLVALYDFYLIISAFINVIKHRKSREPIIMSKNCINLTVAMVEIISLEVAMIYQFGNNDSAFKSLMTSLTGLGVCLINSSLAISMIIKAQKNIKRMH